MSNLATGYIIGSATCSCSREVQQALEEAQIPKVCASTHIEKEYVDVPVYKWQAGDYFIITCSILISIGVGLAWGYHRS